MNKVDGLGVRRARDKYLDAIFDVIDNDIVACHIHELFFLVHLQAVVQLAVYTEDELRGNRYRLHAHIGHHHSASVSLFSK